MLRKIIFFVLLLLPFAPVAQQYVISGRVIDADSRVALPFVNIVINEGQRGGTTDIDGKFRIASREPARTLTLSYVGYETRVVEVDPEASSHVIALKKVEYELPEFVVYPTENPAHRIIRNAVENRDKNDPEQLPAFAYTSYDKMILSSPDVLVCG